MAIDPPEPNGVGPKAALIAFVQALARRQARLDHAEEMARLPVAQRAEKFEVENEEAAL